MPALSSSALHTYEIWWTTIPAFLTTKLTGTRTEGKDRLQGSGCATNVEGSDHVVETS
jgi:hypothetical protein